MATTFFIVDVANSNVIDIRKSDFTPGTPLDAWPRKTKKHDWNNQLWTFVQVPLVEGAFFLQNPTSGLVIDIHHSDYTPGTRLVAGALTNSSPEYWNNQTWYFSKSELENHYYIVNGESGLVIDIENGSSTPGTPLVANTQNTKFPDNKSQTWSFVNRDATTYIYPPKWKETGV